MDNNIALEYNYEILNEKVRKAWDKNVITRAKDIEEKTDHTYTNLILPWVKKKVLLKSNFDDTIIDIGCGCGFLTNLISENARNAIGVDISPVSIEYAKKNYPNISFVCSDICKAKDLPKSKMCVAVMTLNNIPNLDKFFENVLNILEDKGVLIIVIPHPGFWPQRHIADKNFCYSSEQVYEFPFGTKGRRDYSSSTLYFHRSLERYIQLFNEYGFTLTDFKELTEIDNDKNPDILCMELRIYKEK